MNWNSARDQVSFGKAVVSGQGYAASSEFELAAATYFDSTLINYCISIYFDSIFVGNGPSAGQLRALAVGTTITASSTNKESNFAEIS